MKLFDRFRRPQWEHPEAIRRAEAVRNEAAPELIAALPKIAAEDAASEVRRAAIARIDSADVLLGLHEKERDSGCREAIFGRLRTQLLDSKRPIDERRRLAAHPQLPGDLQEVVAESAPEPELREAALARVAKPGLLQRRCLKDPDAALRLRLLERIEDENSLERIAEAARGQDKTLSRRAREKLDALKLARGDEGAINQRALQLGASFDALARTLPTDAQAQLDSLLAEVDSLSPRLDAGLLRRLQGHTESARAAVIALIGAHQPKPERSTEIATTAAADADADAAAADVANAAGAADPAEIEAALEGDPTAAAALVKGTADVHASGAEAAAEPATEPAHAKPKRADAPPDESLSEALKTGLEGVAEQRLGVARPALDAARARIAAKIKASPGQREKLRELEAGVAEMERWQRWAGNKVRARLCDEVEALIGGGMHPDALANRVKELQEEWARVEASEPDHGEHATGIGKRFRALCNKAIAPARPYFEQRRVLRSQKATELEATVTALDAELQQPPDDLKALRDKVVDALRGLDEVDPRSRSQLGKRLRADLEKLDALRDARRAEAVEIKQALLERLRFSTRGDGAAALNAAKAIQSEWKSAPRADRKTEDKLWAELRAVVDPLFDAVRADAQTKSAKIAAADAERGSLLAAAQALSAEDDLASADARLAELEARWQAQAAPQVNGEGARPERDARSSRGPREQDDRRGGRGSDDHGGRDERSERRPRAPRHAEGSIEREFEKAVERVRAAQKAQREARERASLAGFTAAVLDPSRDEGLSDAERRELLAARERSIDPAGCEDALIELELDAAIDSPAEATPRRRALQMQRLAEHMGAGKLDVDPRERLLSWAPYALAASRQQSARAARVFEKLLK